MATDEKDSQISELKKEIEQLKKNEESLKKISEIHIKAVEELSQALVNKNNTIDLLCRGLSHLPEYSTGSSCTTSSAPYNPFKRIP